MASVEAVPGTCSRYFEENFDENEEIRCQNCFKMLEHLKVLTSEIKSAQLTNKILLEELKRTGGEYNFDENLSTYEELNSQSKTYPLSESETPDRNFKNPKKTSRKENSARKSPNSNN
jgi:DNA-directed RNA polymerase subunit RPC12/RpoP